VSIEAQEHWFENKNDEFVTLKKLPRSFRFVEYRPRAAAATTAESEPNGTSTNEPAVHFASARGGTYRWDPENRYAICMDESDTPLRTVTKVHQIEHQIPDDHVFYQGRRANNEGNAPGLPLYSNQLEGITLGDRLTIFAHGNPDSLNNMNPAELASMLQQRGLREVGVLKLFSCSVGAGDFLEQLSIELTRRNIRVGYVSGYTTDLQDSQRVVKVMGKRRAVNQFLPLNAVAAFFPPAWPLIATAGASRTAGRFCLPPSWYQKVVPGNANIVFKGTRYKRA
jgi:hypothetical protein